MPMGYAYTHPDLPIVECLCRHSSGEHATSVGTEVQPAHPDDFLLNAWQVL